MKAKPTLYKGIPFRSRLEARWAAFFDLLEWQWEYEPIDFNGWFPDFVIFGKRPIYVEVKPVIEFPKKVAEKMLRSVDLKSGHWLLILGQRPILEKTWDRGCNCLNIGWATRFFEENESEHFSGSHYIHGKFWNPKTPTAFTVNIKKNTIDFGEPLIFDDGAVFGNGSISVERASKSDQDRLIEFIQKLWGKAHEDTRFKKGSVK